MSEARRKAWADPAVRAKMSEARRKAWADPAVRAKISASLAARRLHQCVYCGVQRSRYAPLMQDGPDTFCCVDEQACERRILKISKPQPEAVKIDMRKLHGAA